MWLLMVVLILIVEELYYISIFQKMHFTCHPFLLLFLPSTMERTSLMFPHRNMEPLSPVTSPRIVTRIQPTLGPDHQNLTTSGKSDSETASPSFFILYQPSSRQTQPPSQPSSKPPSQTSSQPPASLLPPISIQTNLSLPVGSTVRLHCRVSNVEQLQVWSKSKVCQHFYPQYSRSLGSACLSVWLAHPEHWPEHLQQGQQVPGAPLPTQSSVDSTDKRSGGQGPGGVPVPGCHLHRGQDYGVLAAGPQA